MDKAFVMFGEAYGSALRAIPEYLGIEVLISRLSIGQFLFLALFPMLSW